MTVTRDKIEERIEILKSNLAALEKNMIATSGAIQDCEHWLNIINREEPEEVEK